MKRIKQLLLWIMDGIWYAVLLLAFNASAAQPSELFTLYTQYTPGTNTLSACPASTNYADADISLGLWTTNGGPATGWECIDKPRGDTDNTTYLQGFMDATRTDLVLRRALTNGCNISAITVYCRAQSLTSNSVMNVSISKDNATWTSSADQTWTITMGETSSVFTSLGWVAPSYCYVKIGGSTLDYNTVSLVNMQIMVNP